MLWFLRDYALAAVVLRAATLAFTSILIGGLFFAAVLLPRPTAHMAWPTEPRPRWRRLLVFAAVGLIATQVIFAFLDGALLIETAGLHLSDLWTASFLQASALLIAGAIAILLFLWRTARMPAAALLLALPLICGTVWTSHAASRMDNRLPLIALTAMHQLSVALWIGSMPFLWLLLAATSSQDARMGEIVSRRYSKAALASVVALIVSGVLLAWQYTGSWSGVYGTGYGLVLILKTLLLGPLLLLGAANFWALRQPAGRIQSFLPRLRLFSEAEIGIGFTIILAAASLTAQPPAVDVTQGRVTLPEIVARFTPQWPRLQTPPLKALPPVASMTQAERQYAANPDDPKAANDAAERAWSEYNHHWAGMVVLAAGLLAFLAKAGWGRWARHWPLAFLGLAVFLFLRADPEAWPLGPRGFWVSFYNPEDLVHRLIVLLIVCFAGFEWSVQNWSLKDTRAALVFPGVCALGGALLLLHEHAMGSAQEELLTSMSHAAIAVFAVIAGWSRWLEIRSPRLTRVRTVAAVLWPVCLIAIGLVLLNYREA